MNERAATRNSVTSGTANIAALDLVSTALERIKSRRAGSPRIGVIYAPAGWGKSFCTNVIANQERGYYVQMKSAWRGKTLLEKILVEMGVAISGKTTIPKLLDAVCAQLSNSQRILIIDEFDHCTKSDALVELVRDIYEGSQSAILLAGEEGLPSKLEEWERFHSRCWWSPIPPVSMEDFAKLAPIYCPDVAIGDDIADYLMASPKVSVRRVCVNLMLLHDHCMTMGVKRVSLADVDEQSFFYTGRSPERRL